MFKVHLGAMGEILLQANPYQKIYLPKFLPTMIFA